jgi:hypothetical protein
MVSGWDWVECPERTTKLGGDSEDVRALAGDHAVGLNQAVAEHGDYAEVTRNTEHFPFWMICFV